MKDYAQHRMDYVNGQTQEALVREEPSFGELVDDIQLRCKYGEFLKSRNNPRLSFEQWKQKYTGVL